MATIMTKDELNQLGYDKALAEYNELSTAITVLAAKEQRSYTIKNGAEEQSVVYADLSSLIIRQEKLYAQIQAHVEYHHGGTTILTGGA